MTEIAVRPTQAVDPQSGEVLALDRPTEDLGAFLYRVRDFESRLKEAKALVSEEILRRQDADASWTTRAGDYELKGASPQPKTEWDAEALKIILFDLMSEGLISVNAADAALKTETVYKPQPKGLNALMKLGEGIKERLLPAKTKTAKRRYVSVSRHD